MTQSREHINCWRENDSDDSLCIPWQAFLDSEDDSPKTFFRFQDLENEEKRHVTYGRVPQVPACNVYCGSLWWKETHCTLCQFFVIMINWYCVCIIACHNDIVLSCALLTPDELHFPDQSECDRLFTQVLTASYSRLANQISRIHTKSQI